MTRIPLMLALLVKLLQILLKCQSLSSIHHMEYYPLMPAGGAATFVAIFSAIDFISSALLKFVGEVQQLVWKRSQQNKQDAILH